MSRVRGVPGEETRKTQVSGQKGGEIGRDDKRHNRHKNRPAHFQNVPAQTTQKAQTAQTAQIQNVPAQKAEKAKTAQTAQTAH